MSTRATKEGPRAKGTNPRAKGTNLNARGMSPRQLKTNKRAVESTGSGAGADAEKGGTR